MKSTGVFERHQQQQAMDSMEERTLKIENCGHQSQVPTIVSYVTLSLLN